MEHAASVLIIVVIATFATRPIRAQGWTFQPIGEGWQSDGVTERDDESVDYRFVNYQAMLETGQAFHHENLVSYVQLEIDEDMGREQLLVGARDTLFRLHLENLTMLETADWKATPDKTLQCTNSGHHEETCHNFIRVLILQESLVFTCGTNSFQPNCTWRNAENLQKVISSEEGRGLCPYSPYFNATALMTSEGDLYTATVIDSIGRDSVIYRSLGTAPKLRTMRGDSHWLNDPSYISAYEIDNFVYFFFRETAVEYINCGKRVFSRVARVCKSDVGRDFGMQKIWSTFTKARLNCSLPGEYPFYFDEIQSTFLSKEERLIYAVFSTPPNSMAGSAVCVYDFDSLKAAFDGPFKHQESPTSAWLMKDYPQRAKCDGGGSRSYRSSESKVDVSEPAKYLLLMDKAVMPKEVGPLIMRENERWTKVVVDHVVAKSGTYDVIFLATEDGKIRKMMRHPKGNSTCLIEEIKIVPNGKPKPIQNMKLSIEQGAVYIATTGSIYRIPVQRCHRFTTSMACINAQDPYCGWNQRKKQCIPAPDGNVHDNSWEQNVVHCPVLDYPVNGGWSEWSRWNQCPYAGPDKSIDYCQCRSRSCDRPAPAFNGRACAGPSMQIINCTVNGGWTIWSAWSACSQTCGFAIRQRTRQCGSPAPKFGGKTCQGKPVEEEYCRDTPECPLVPVNGVWSDWAGWSTCTTNCNGGLQTRKRACDQPPPMKGGNTCPGNKEEWRMCNTQVCGEVTKLSPWTEWIQTNRTKGGYFQQRFRFSCRANVESAKDIKTSFAESQAHFCFKKDKTCFKPNEVAHSVTTVDINSNWERFLKSVCLPRRKLFKNYCNCRTLGVFLVCQKCGFG